MNVVPQNDTFAAHIQWIEERIDSVLASLKAVFKKHGFVVTRSKNMEAPRQAPCVRLELRPRGKQANPIFIAKFEAFRNGRLMIETINRGYRYNDPWISMDDERQVARVIGNAIHSMLLAAEMHDL